MLNYLCPKQFAEGIHQVDLHDLKRKGIAGLILDLDNTLVPWNGHAVFPEVRSWIDEAKKRGFNACIVSNNDAGRGEKVREIFGLPAFWKAVKPRRRTFRKALDLLKLTPPQVAVVGDQIFTDILGGNRMGFYTILVRPLNKREFLGTMCVRKVEKVVLRGLKQRGYLE